MFQIILKSYSVRSSAKDCLRSAKKRGVFFILRFGQQVDRTIGEWL